MVDEAAPESTPPTNPVGAPGRPPGPGGVSQVSVDPETGLVSRATCLVCGYDLAGLEPTGVCPECGTPIERSLQENMLANVSTEYLRTLRSGIAMTKASILVTLLAIIAPFGFAVLIGFRPGQAVGNLLELTTQLLSLFGSALLVFGWWNISALDPRYIGANDASRSRAVVRPALVTYGVAMLIGFVTGLVMTFAPMQAATALGVLTAAVGLLGFVAFVVVFFASMVYLRWLTPRIPNEKAHKRARTLIWLIPVLSVSGFVIVPVIAAISVAAGAPIALLGIVFILVGPLISVILYYNLHNTIGKDIKRILAERPESELALS